MEMGSATCLASLTKSCFFMEMTMSFIIDLEVLDERETQMKSVTMEK